VSSTLDHCGGKRKRPVNGLQGASKPGLYLNKRIEGFGKKDARRIEVTAKNERNGM
jgi:hypothetical protein